MTNLNRKNETKLRKKKRSPHNFAVYKVPLLQLACIASYISLIYQPGKKNVRQQRMPFKDIYGWLIEEARISFGNTCTMDFFFN